MNIVLQFLHVQTNRQTGSTLQRFPLCWNVPEINKSGRKSEQINLTNWKISITVQRGVLHYIF